MIKEEWKKIPGYENYEASNIGRIKSLRRITGNLPNIGDGTRITPEKILKPYINNGGYYSVGVSNSEHRRQYGVHQLVMRAFEGVPTEGYCVNHKDGNKLNNLLDNLEYVTFAENTAHAHATGLINYKNRTFRKKLGL